MVITRHGKPYARVLAIEGEGPINREPGVLGWAPGTHDPAICAPMAGEEMAAEGWP